MSHPVDPPDAIEVNDFRFVQLRKLKVTQAGETVPEDAVNLIATSSRYGLVFVGFSGGFKVLKLENILDQDEDKQKLRQVADNYPCQTVLCARPVLLSLSSDDMTLAVCVVIDDRVVADMYDIRAFADTTQVPVPFLNVQLSSYGAALQDFMWNPVVVEMYVFCLSDGSLHVHEVVDVSLRISASLAAGATSVCWSPKGKQVVVGKKNGFFSQYKPTLQEAKTIPPPQKSEGPVEVINIHWLTTTSFAVVYVTPDLVPDLMVVSTPKGAPVTYTTFSDVCFGSVTGRRIRYLMHHQPEWGILTCTSSSAVETAVLGCFNAEKAVWLQWVLQDVGRAEVPLEKYVETFPLGMNMIFCAQRRIVISDEESYQPMPILFLLSTSGLLCPFHVLNLRPGMQSCVYPAEPISFDGERKSLGAVTTMKPADTQIMPQMLTAAAVAITSSVPVPQPMSVLATSSVSTSMPVPTKSLLGMWDNKPAFSFPKTEHSPSLFAPRNQASFMPVQSAPVAQIPTPIPSAAVEWPHDEPAVGSPFYTLPIEMTSYTHKSSSAPRTVEHVIHEEPAQVSPVKPTAQVSVSDNNKKSETSSPSQDIYIAAMIDEIKRFEADLRSLRNLSFKSHIGTQEEIADIRKNSLLLTDCHKDIKDTMKSLSCDIHNLKTASLESFAMVGEAKSRNVRRNDPKYISILRDRSLDPVAAKRHQKMNQLHQYLNTQLQEVHDKLDRDLMESVEKERSKRRLRISSSQAIYQTIVSNQNIIYNLKSSVDRLSDGFNKLKITNAARHHHFLNASALSPDGDLEKLADSLLQDVKQTEPAKRRLYGRKKLNSDIQNTLRNFFANRPVTCQRPKPITSPSQSQLLSLSMLQSEVSPRSTTISSSKKAEMSTPTMVSASLPISSPDIGLTPISTTPPFQGIKKMVNIFKSPLELKPLSTFTMKSGPQALGCITEGTPVVKAIADNKHKMTNFTVDELQKRNVIVTPLPAKSSAFTNVATEAKSEGIDTSKSLFNWKSPISAFSFSKTDQSSSATPSFSGLSFEAKASSPDKSKLTPTTLFKIPETDTLLPSNEEFVLYEDISPPDSPAIGNDQSFGGVSVIDSVSSLGKQTVYEIRSPGSVQATTLFPANAFSFTQSSFTSTSGSQLEPSGEVFIVSTAKDDLSEGKENVLNLSPTVTVFNVPSSLSIIKSPSTSSVSILSPSNKTFQQLMAGNVNSGRLVEDVPIQTLPVQFVSLTNTGSPYLTPTLQQNEPLAIIKEVSTEVVSSSDDPTSFKNVTPGEVQSRAFQLTKLGQDKPLSEISITKVVPSVVNLEIKSPASTVALQEEPDTTSTAEIGRQTATSATTVSTSSSFFGQNTAATTSNFFGAIPGFSTTSSSSSFDQNPATTTSSFFSSPTTTQSSFFGKTLFGQSTVTTTTTSSSVFGRTAATTSVFGQTATAESTSSPFGQTTTVSSAASSFGPATTEVTAASPFGQATTVTAAISPFGQATTAVTATSPFGQAATVASATSPFGQAATITGATSPFGQVSAAIAATSPFGQVTTTASTSVFGQPAGAISPFGQTVSPFGQSNTTGSIFGQTSATSSFFSPPSTEQTSIFGQKEQQPSSGSIFGGGGQSSGFFGKSAFGQSQPSNSFGLAKAVFGQPDAQASGAFSQPADPSNLFGQGSFFGGLGGKPSEENASKNVFGSRNVASPGNTNNLFGNQGASVFGSKTGGFSTGSFTTGGGTVSQSGFGAFQQSPQKSAASFGAAAAFGSSATFGGSPGFGSPPMFGSSPGTGAVGGASPFGNVQLPNFSNFASTDAPTFGSLASQTGGFGSLQQPQQQQQQQQASGFGQPAQGSMFGNSPPAGTSLFGNAAGSPSGFGGQQSGFGSPSSSGGASAFTQWRN